jgi:ATP-dependent RNA helicase DeaD
MKPIDVMAEDAALAAEILESIKHAVPGAVVSQRLPKPKSKKKDNGHSGTPNSFPKDATAKPRPTLPVPAATVSPAVAKRPADQGTLSHTINEVVEDLALDPSLEPMVSNIPAPIPTIPAPSPTLPAPILTVQATSPVSHASESPVPSLADSLDRTEHVVPKPEPTIIAPPSQPTFIALPETLMPTSMPTSNNPAEKKSVPSPLDNATRPIASQPQVAHTAPSHVADRHVSDHAAHDESTSMGIPSNHFQTSPVAIATQTEVADEIFEGSEFEMEDAELDTLETEDSIDVESGDLDVDSTPDDSRVRFRDLDLPAEICSALEQSGYQYPTDIQAATIPALLRGRDVLGQAQTGTGKTAAFALPLLSRIDVNVPETQVLVLTPTRELAIQVSESFLRYGQHLRGLRVAPIYGGSSYTTQIHALRRGAHVVVGTPGRVMDHMRENRLRIDTLQALVLDEADEMLRMGFVDDVQWVLEQTPPQRQIALFSATMPDPIRQIANRHLKNPHVIQIESKQRTADNIDQRFVIVDPRGKMEALQRILEAEDFDGLIIFVKTKIATVEVADYLKALGYSAVALNGDIAQTQRERTIEQLKDGAIDILVATDVAARGLDVQRITHVINYDLPFDAEAYVHRIGRTGRAGRSGHAIVFIAPKQRGFLREIDRAAGQNIDPMAIPTAKEINTLRVNRFKEGIVKACSDASRNQEIFALFEKLISQCVTEHGLDASQIAAGLATISQGDRPFFVSESTERFGRRDSAAFERDRGRDRDDRGRRDFGGDNRGDAGGPRGRKRPDRSGENDFSGLGSEKETFRVEVGRIHGVKPGNLVGAVANEIGLDSNMIGQIRIQHDFSTIDLPAGMPREVFKVLGRAWVVGRQLRISKLSDHPTERSAYKGKKKFSN